MLVQREHVGDVLVGAHDDDAARLAVHATQVEDVSGARVGAERLLVVDQAEPALAGQQDGRQLVDGQVTVALLEDGADVDNGVRIRRPRA